MSPAGYMRRLAIVLSHPTQYYSPWFRWLAGREAIDLKVFYLWDFGIREMLDSGFKGPVKWDVDLLSGYAHEFVANAARNPGTDRFLGLQSPGLTKALKSWNPGAILLFGYKWYSHVRVILWARIHGIPLIFRGDSHFIGRDKPGWAKAALLRLVYRQFAAVTYVGASNRDYFSTLGVPESRLFFAPHSIDDKLFDTENPGHQAAAASLRNKLGLGPADRVLLFAGKFSPEKQPRELLQAFLSLGRRDTALVFVGDGAERPALEALVREKANLQENVKVRFLPFANQSEMPSRYLLADVFVLPSRGLYETWGLAVNEAMHMGVPCIVSNRVGCQRDLVTPGETGWVFDPADPRALSDTLAQALGEVGSLERATDLRRAVRNRVTGYTYAATSSGLLAALSSLR